MTRGAFLAALDGIRIWRRRGVRAPHKPLLLLLALGRLANGAPRLARYEDEVHEPLADLLARFGPPRQQFHPEQPFWRLRRDGLWEIPGAGSLRTTAAGDVSPTLLRRQGVCGGFPRDIETLLRSDPTLIEEAAARLLAAHFPESLHEAIRNAAGLPDPPAVAAEDAPAYGKHRPARRDPAFRRRVLVAYERRCSVCDFDIRVADVLLGIEAAHIRWHACDGPDEVPNGLALCQLHHRALDLGAIGLEPLGPAAARPRYRLLVSQELSGMSRAYRRLVGAAGQPVRPPQDPADAPDPAFVAWHRDQVFRGRPRPGSF